MKRATSSGPARVAWVLVLLLAAAFASDSDRKRLSGGEVVVTRLPPGPGGGVAGESRGVIPAPVARVWSVLLRANEQHEYMPNYLASWLVDCAATSAVRRRDDWQRPDLERAIQKHRLWDWPADTVLFYNVVDLPFPFPDRWSLLKLRRDTAAKTIYWNEVVGNVKTNDGSWKLEPWGADSTLVTYWNVSVPGLRVPEFLLDIGMNQTLPAVIKNLRARVLR